MKGYQAIPELVRRAGVADVFGMVGGSNVPWLAQGVETDAFKFIRTRHEQTAVNAAAGYGRASDFVGVCTVTHGPGFANSIGPLVAARASRHPLIMIVGETPPADDASQGLDQTALIHAIGVGGHHVRDGDRLQDQFSAALNTARRAGCPQVLTIDGAVLKGEVTLRPEEQSSPPTREAFEPDSIRAAVTAMAESRNPLLLAGQGAVIAGCRTEMEELAELIGARLGNTLRANSFFSGHPNNVGLCGGWSPPPVREAITDTDLVVAVGASLNEHTTDNWALFADARIIQCEIDRDRSSLASTPELRIHGDARQTVQALVDAWRQSGSRARPRIDPAPARPDIVRSLLDKDLGHDPKRGIDPRQVFHLMDERLPPDRIVVTDWGQSLGGASPSLLNAPDANSWILGRANGVIGLGLGLAIGAATARPKRPVTLFTGDGGFMLSMQDLDGARLAAVDLTAIILNDERYGSEVKYLDGFGLPHRVIKQDLPDIPTLAHAFGGHGFVIDSQQDFEKLDLPHQGLVLVDVRIDPEINLRGLFR